MAPLLCYVTDRAALAAEAKEEALLGMAKRAIAAGVDWIQIREKDLSGRSLVCLTRAFLQAAAGTSVRILVNDRLDVAVAAGAAGVHLGGESLPVQDVVKWCAKYFAQPKSSGEQKVATTFLVGKSCHSLQEALQAEGDGASYIIFGPVFPTPSKLQFGSPQGIERLAEVCRRIRIPVLAIGGITAENAAECFRAGAAGIAAIRLFQQGSDLVALMSHLCSR